MTKIDELCSVKYLDNTTPEELLKEYNLLKTKGEQARFINAINACGHFDAIFDFLTLTSFFKNPFGKDKATKHYKLKTTAGVTNYFVEYTGKLREELKPYDTDPYRADNGENYKTAFLLKFEKR